MKNKLVVYTALFGDYDDLMDPKENFAGCDFICFTDQENLAVNIWEIRHVNNHDLTKIMLNRKYKILPHLFLSEYEWSLYVDANIKILKNPLELAEKYLLKYDLVMPKHFLRDCVYDEAKENLILGKVKYDQVHEQMNKYKKDGMPRKFGLGENGILLRRHNNHNVVKLMNDWWEELNIHTKRDQLSLAYVLWKNGQNFNYMDESARNSTGYFEYTIHKDVNKDFFSKAKKKIEIYIKSYLYRNFVEMLFL